MFITGIGRATPVNCYSQEECWEALKTSAQFENLGTRSRSILRKVLLGDNGIETRHLALSPLGEAFLLTPDILHERFARAAPSLATEAARVALAQAGRQPEEIDAVIISTCTGYLCPGLSSYVVERLGLSGGIIALDLVGQGCGAAVPNLQTAQALLDSRRCERVLSVCVEVCSAAFYLDDDPGVLVSACLFGDGAGAAILENSPASAIRSTVEWLTADNLMKPESRDLLRFEQKGGMLRNRLDKRVPFVVGSLARELFDLSAKKHSFSKEQIRAWIFHSGGRDVLAELTTAFGLREEDLCWSRETLRNYGNISSPSVLLSLENALRGRAAEGLWWLSSFGAGLSCHGALLRIKYESPC